MGRADRGMVTAGLGAILLCVNPTVRLSGQTLDFGIGVRHTSALVHDSIVSPFDVRVGLAPVLALTVRTQLERGWSAEVLLDYAWSGLERHESGDVVGLGSVRTVAASVALRRPLPARLSGRVGVGGLVYLPSAETGIFRQGTSPLTALGSLALRYEAPPGRTRGGLAAEARYDVHRFITPALRTVGFSSGRLVHRVALVVSARALGASR